MRRLAKELAIEARRGLDRARELTRSEGLVPTARFFAVLLIEHIEYPMIRRRRAVARFHFDGKQLPYAYYLYGHTWRNERALEIAIAQYFLDRRPLGRMLEVGNVLGHFGVRGHDVIDKYERVQGIISDDIVTRNTERQYDTVVSISTLEHVRFDEPQQDPHGSTLALENLRRAVRPGGRVLVTIPLGYNSGLDEDIRARRFSFAQQFYYMRTSKDNDWVEVAEEEALTCSYDSPYEAANALLVGIDDPGV